jgi:hypothetical protein
MRQLLPLILTASSLFAADAQPQPVPPTQQPPTVVPAPPVGPQVQPGMPRPEAMKELREVETQWRALRDKAAQDPELVAAKKAVEDAQKAYRAKEEEVMAKDPSYAEVKAKREAVRAKLMPPRPELPAGGAAPIHAQVVPVQAPVPAPVAPAPAH